MFRCAYDTAAASAYRIDDLKRAIEDLLTEDKLYSTNNSPRSYFVTEENRHLRPFPHPLLVDGVREQMVVADARAVAKIHRDSETLVGGADFDYVERRVSIIDYMWMDGNTRDLLNLGDLPARAYASILSETLGKRLYLSEELTRIVQIFAAYFYLCLFYDFKELDEIAVQGLAKRVARISGANAGEVMETISNYDPPQTINDFIGLLQEHTESMRLEKLTASSLFRVLGGIWFGPNAAEQVAVGLEHPPTWSAMVATVVSHRGYQKTALSKTIRMIDRRGELSDHFMLNLQRGTTEE